MVWGGLAFTPGAVGQEPARLMYGQVSKAPTSLSSSLQVVIPDWQPDHFFTITDWPVDHPTLPQVGDECLLGLDNRVGLWLIRWVGVRTPTWITPTLINSWAQAFTSPNIRVGYLKDALGFVHLRGRLKSGTSGTVAFQLPAGYRPGNSSDTYAAVAINGTTPVAALSAIDTSGNVYLYIAATFTDVGVAGITFLAEN